MTIATILGSKGASVTTLTAETTVGQAVALLAEHRIGAAPVMSGDTVAGIFSERDVIHCLQRDGASALDRSVRDGMTSPVVSVGRQETVIEALGLMTRRRIRHLPVVEGGRLVGFVSIGDLVKYRIDRTQADAEAMREYIASA
jgi:CBS domain-containing protein